MDDDDLRYVGRRNLKKQRVDLTQEAAEPEQSRFHRELSVLAQENRCIDLTEEPDTYQTPRQVIDLTDESDDDIRIISSNQVAINLDDDDRADSAIGTPVQERVNPCVVM